MKTRLQYYRDVPFNRLWSLYAAVFCLFALTGFFGNMLNLGNTPYLIVLLNAVFSGFVAVMYLHVGTKMEPRYFLHVSLLQVPIWVGFTMLSGWLVSRFGLHPDHSALNSRLTGGVMLVLVITSYSLFIRFLRSEGQEALRVRNELELAHGIQKTLVPPVNLQTAHFEIYGRSDPSEQVGGDLVDIVHLQDGTTVAYLADIAGHGLQAGILMGMVKTAARTALLEPQAGDDGAVLSSLMERLNTVLPGVKESQMYATFAGFALRDDGTVYYALAAHPAFLHLRVGKGIERLSYDQLPLGLLPSTGFSADATTMAKDDLLAVVTDGILEACNADGEEFGIERLESIVAENAAKSLPDLAATILKAVRTFGSQIDDQTLLLIRMR